MTKMYSDALAVQSAVNLSGVVHAFSEAMDELWAEADYMGEGTDYVNQHPVSVLFAGAIYRLTRPGYNREFTAGDTAWFDASEYACRLGVLDEETEAE